MSTRSVVDQIYARAAPDKLALQQKLFVDTIFFKAGGTYKIPPYFWTQPAGLSRDWLHGLSEKFRSGFIAPKPNLS